MTDTPPDRLSLDPTSPHYDAGVLGRGIRIILNGRERHDVHEYCISEGWALVPAGKSLDRRGNPLTVKIRGTVVAAFSDIHHPLGS